MPTEGFMKRTLRIPILLFALFIISDEVWSALVALLLNAYTASLFDSAWQLSTYESAYLLVTAIVFVAAGSIVAYFSPQRYEALLLALALGVAVPASRLLFEQPLPWFYQNHGVSWLRLAISWANWWLPALGACTGAIVAHGLRSKQV